jgi:hypothetical protein
MKLNNLILLFPIITSLVIPLVNLELFNSEIALGKTPQKRIIKGYCGKQKCENRWKQLTKFYPEYIEIYNKECQPNNIISLVIDDENKKIYFTCWDAKKPKYGSRFGAYLGTLPIPGNEDKFLTPLPTDPPYAKYLQEKYSNQVKKAQFKCSTKGGNFNFLISKDQKLIQLQCYFQAGVNFTDDNNDWVSDSETRGAGVYEILGTFPLPTVNK